MSFEDSLQTRLTVGQSDPPETDLEYYARPENYTGSNIFAMQRVAMAKKKLTTPEDEPGGDRAAHNQAVSKLLDRYKDVGPSQSASNTSLYVVEVQRSRPDLRARTASLHPSSAQSRPSSAGAHAQESRKRRKSLSDRAGSANDITTDSRASTPRDRWRKLSRRFSDAKLTSHSDSDSQSDVSRKLSVVSRGSGPYRSARSSSSLNLTAKEVRMQLVSNTPFIIHYNSLPCNVNYFAQQLVLKSMVSILIILYIKITMCCQC